MKKYKRGSGKREGNNPSSSRFSFVICYLLFVICFFSSCATSPKAGPAQSDGVPDFSVLPSCANVYLWADAGQSKPLLEALSFNGMSGRDASQILDRTDTAVAAFYPEGGASFGSGPSRRFFLAGRGNYPNLRAGFSMSFSKDWKKIKSPTGNRYWFSEAYNLGVALGSRLAFVSDGDPFAQGSGIDPAPQGFEEFRRPCVLAGWHNDAGVQLNSVLDGMGIPLKIPVEGLFFGFIRAGEEAGQEKKFETVVRVKTPSASQAGALVSLLSMARIFMGGRTDFVGRLLSNAPVQDGPDMCINIPPLSAEEIALLFNAFSVYAK